MSIMLPVFIFILCVFYTMYLDPIPFPTPSHLSSATDLLPPNKIKEKNEKFKGGNSKFHHGSSSVTQLVTQ